MARTSRWNESDRAKLLKMVKGGVSEQEIRGNFQTKGVKGASRDMTAIEFAQQLKQAMVEAGDIKQEVRKKEKAQAVIYKVTNTGRLTITDFGELTGADEGASFTLEKPRGRSKAWRLVPAK
ncbi:hypothetical protein [Desulfoferula mesophila]|uniref:hypothetical protein n=1 Tax=Desulfoferula mesophila TaxID=3058419 RepID=UPI0030CCE0C6